MPVADTTYPRRRIEPYLLGLLPDRDDVRQRWGEKLGVSAENPFALLEHMGLDVAGAVQFVSSSLDDALERPPAIVPLSDDDVATRIANLRSDPTSWTVPGERWSLAGAQAKFTLARSRDGRWSEPSGSAASTHIIKPGIAEYRDQAVNEHVCMTVAGRLGLPVARTEFRAFGDQAALVVTRYDRRRRPDGSVLRVHQEDMCQALSVYPRRKYESSKGPTAGQVSDLLRAVTGADVASLTTFARAVAYNYLIGAPDAHAKNYSLLLAGEDARLAPLYDVASAFPYEPARADHELDRAAMAIGGRRSFGSLEARHWDGFASRCHVDGPALREWVASACVDLPDLFATAFDDLPESAPGLRERMLAAVQLHCDRTAAGLAGHLTGAWRAPAHAAAAARFAAHP